MRRELMEKLGAITQEEEKLLAGGGVDQALYTSCHAFTVESGRLLSRGRLITMRPHTRFAAFPPHTHNYIEIVYMCAGHTFHRVNNSPALELKAGELLFLNQHARHGVEKAGQEDIGVNFIVLPQFFDYALDMTGTGNVLARFLLDGLRKRGGEFSCLHFQCGQALPIQNLVENLLWRLIDSGGASDRVTQATMGLLLMELLNSPENLLKEGAGQGGAVMAALGEIQRNYRQADLTRLAKELHVSLPYLSSAIHQATGQTFKELLREKRLGRGAELLAETTLPVEDIIGAVGYDNTSYFYRKFRERYGMSPKQYRENARRQT